MELHVPGERPPTIESLRTRLEEAEEMIRAIQQGAVDAFVLEELGRHRVYTLEGADRPYRLFVEQMQQGVATMSTDGVIVYCNRRLPEMLRAAHGDVLGKPLRDFVVDDDREAYDVLLEQGRTRTGRGEVRLQRGGDGGTLPAYVTLSALPGECSGFVGAFVTDLTVQKQHAQLAAAQEALREADRRKDEFLAMLAHELRGPLAPLGNMLEVMKRANGNVELLQQARDTMERQLGHLVRLVDDLLDVSRITRNKLELRKERVDLGTILRRGIETAFPLGEPEGRALTVTLPPDPIQVDADPARLTQVFHNLLSNAYKFTEPGGRISITVETSADPGGVVVRVEDSGVGIPADRLKSIFEPFTQVDRSLERSQGGLGIGLTLVKRLVEMHGGKVHAESGGPGLGSAFVVRVPGPSAEPPEDRPGAADKGESVSSARRFLIVDDHPDSADSLARLLSIAGNETHTAHDGLEALSAAERLRPEVVLMDIGLPKLNGFEAARRIREQTWGKGMALIALTGWGQDEDRQRSKNAGFDGHMVKPVDFEALMKLLSALEGKHGVA